MINDKRVLAIVPARTGSKRIPLKNFMRCAGKMLYRWTLAEAGKSKYIDWTVFATDSGFYEGMFKGTLEHYSRTVLYIRKHITAGDDATSLDLVLEVISNFPGYDVIVLLQPTSPTRTVEDIDNCIKYLDENDYNMVASCNGTDQVANGSVYVNRLESIFRRETYETEDCALLEVPFTTDIDNWTDLDDAETVLNIRRASLVPVFGHTL